MSNNNTLDSGYVYVDAVKVAVKRAFATIATGSTASNIITGVASKKLRILSIQIINGTIATSITFNSASAAISPAFTLGANGSLAFPFNPHGHLETVAAEALTATTSAAGSSIGVLVSYVEV